MKIGIQSRKISEMKVIPAASVLDHEWTVIKFADGSITSTISNVAAVIGDWIGFDSHGFIWVKHE